MNFNQCNKSNAIKVTSDANGFKRPTRIFRFLNIKKMAANDREHAMHNGQYWLSKWQFKLVINVLGMN